MSIIDRSSRRVLLVVAMVAATLAAGQPAASAGPPGKTGHPHKKHHKKKKKASKPASKGFKVSAVGSRHYTLSYQGPAPALAFRNTTLDWDWGATGHAKVRRTRYGPAIDIDRLAFKLHSYEGRSRNGYTGPKFDFSISPPQWDSKSYITCESSSHLALTGPADLSGYISGERPEDLHAVFASAAPAEVTSEATATDDPNSAPPPPGSGFLKNTINLDGREFEARPAWAGDDGTNCSAGGSFDKGWTRHCSYQHQTASPDGTRTTNVYELTIKLSP
jgi:hypothetical protein